MFGINEIISKLSSSTLTKEERFRFLKNKITGVSIDVVEYLMNRLDNLYIEVLGNYAGDLFELMSAGKLEGWCWQTTESAIVFLNDDDYIERGNLKFDDNNKYYHSWICFNYNGVEYVLDPCLSFLCKKKYYSKIFEIEVLGKVSAKEVRDELIKQIMLPKEEDSSEAHKAFENFMKNFWGDSYDEYKEKKKGEVVVHGPEDVNTPLYRNGAGYKTEIDVDKIKRMTVHYYWIDC